MVIQVICGGYSDVVVVLLLQVKDKFCLDMDEEQAVQHFQSLIDESVRAIMAVVVEQIHKWAQVREIYCFVQPLQKVHQM